MIFRLSQYGRGHLRPKMAKGLKGLKCIFVHNTYVDVKHAYLRAGFNSSASLFNLQKQKSYEMWPRASRK